MPRLGDYDYQPYVYWRERPKGLEEFGARLRQAREGAKLTQAALAGRAKFSEGFIRGLENGSKRPSFRSSLILSAVLNVDADWLISGNGEP